MRWLTRDKKKAAKPGKTKRAATARKRPMPRWAKRAMRGAAAAVVLGAVVGGPIWLWKSGWVAETTGSFAASVSQSLGDAGLRVEQVYLHGRVNESAESIADALAIDRGTPLLSVDLKRARARVEALSWVRVAGIKREFPNAIRVTVSERRPLALWQRGTKLTLVDDEGVIITDRGLDRFANLLVIVGDDAPSHAQELLATLSAEPGLMDRVDAAVRVGKRRWNVRMDNGVFVRLPEKDADGAWHRFARLEREHGLLKQDLLSIDLRIPDQLIVRTRVERPALERKVRDRRGKDT
jgi:cell division protein FtsQ